MADPERNEDGDEPGDDVPIEGDEGDEGDDELAADVASRADAVAARRREGRQSRGHGQVIGLDLGAMAGRPELEPIVQYLTYIQSRRGDDSHLLFVRYDDLDEMAAYEGQETSSFLERLDQLGVVISPN